MEVEFELGIDDVLAFSRYHERRSPAVRRARRLQQLILAIFAFLVFLAYGLVCALTASPETFLLDIRFMAGFGSVWLLFLALSIAARHIQGRVFRRMLDEGKNKSTIGKHRLSVGQRGIMDLTAFSEQCTTWQGVERIADNEEYIFLYINAISAHVIPKCAFEHMRHMKVFLDEARRLKAEADARASQQENEPSVR